MKATLLLTGCIACSLGGSRPNYHYYVLTATPAAPAQPGHGRRTFAVDRVTIPGYLDREQIATRTVGQHLSYSSTDRWAEPLDQAFARTLTEDLAPLLDARGIQVEAHVAHPTYELSIDVVRFERTAPDQVELRARWVLRTDTDVVDSGEIQARVPTPGTDSNATAIALSEAISRMASQLADRVHATDALAARA